MKLVCFFLFFEGVIFAPFLTMNRKQISIELWRHLTLLQRKIITNKNFIFYHNISIFLLIVFEKG